MMMIRWRLAILMVLCAGLVFESGCMTRKNASGSVPPPDPSPPAGITIKSQSMPGAELSELHADDGVVPVTKHNGVPYVEAGRLLGLIGMKSHWDGGDGTYGFGYKDALLGVKAGASDAMKYGDPVTLAESPMLINSRLFLPVSALPTLLGDFVSYNFAGDKLQLIAENNSGALSEDVSSDLNFGDDPQDPLKDDPLIRSLFEKPTFQSDSMTPSEADAVPATAHKPVNMAALIQKARQYLGAPYIFGASSFAATGGFDCSLYTQYIFGKFNIRLPRLARQQAEIGQLISRQNLRIGDLVFFTIPGRFSSNKIAGHVGIYIGNGQMINANSAPQNGVQITDMNKPFWQRTFFQARRAA